MPDQSSAADEHALIQEITAPLEKLPDDPVPIAADVNFPLALRGYDRIAVDAYVKKTSQLVAEMQATRSPDSAVRRALERVGQEVSGILQRAHETSEQITTQSRREAEERLDRARKEEARITSDAHARLKDLDSETDRIWAERQQIVEDTRQLARQLLALADTAVERFPPAEEQAAGAAEGGEMAPEAAAPSPVAERPKPEVFDHAATQVPPERPIDDEAEVAPEDAVEAGPGVLPDQPVEVGQEGAREQRVEVGQEGAREQRVEAGQEGAREQRVEADQEAPREHPTSSDDDLSDNEATAVLPRVRPAESGEQHQ